MFSRCVGVCFLAISVVVFEPTVFAGKVELTSYYPSPYGEFKNLKSTEDSQLATDSGNVGVGTTTPATKLQINIMNPFPGTTSPNGMLSDFANTVSIATTDAAAANIGGMLVLGGKYSANNTGVFGGIRGAKENATLGEGAGYLSFYTLWQGNNFGERMRITSDGTVGINKTSPQKSQLNPVAGNNRTVRLDVDESIVADDVFLRQPSFGPETPRWASAKYWSPGEHCGLFTNGAADGVDVNIPCNGMPIYKGGDMDDKDNYQCPDGFAKAGGDYQSPRNRYWWTCVKS